MTNKPKTEKPAGFTDLNCTGYRLRKATRRVTSLYDAELAPTGLTVTQFNILAMVATTGPQPMSTLADALGMDASTLTRTLKPLLARGEVEIAVGEDRRVKHVALTDDGKEVVAQAVPYWRAAQKRIERALGDEITHLHTLLSRVSRAADDEQADASANSELRS